MSGHRLPRLRLGLVALGFSLMAGSLTGDLAARQARPQDVLLAAAIRTETVDGDLPGAIKQYEAIVERYRTEDRAVAAQALVRMAECHRKLGRATARGLFERVLREFGDQKDAVATAESRLAPGEPPARSGTRRLWTLPDDANAAGTVSYDGRLLTYVDWSDEGGANLFVRTLTGGVTRRLTDSQNVPGARWPRFAERAAFSRDGRQVAYSWFDTGTDRMQVRIASLAPGAAAAPRVIADLASPSWINPHDWTRDGEWIAAVWQIDRGSREIGLVSTRDGSRRALKTIALPCACSFALSLSPDGKLLAFDLPGLETWARDLVVIDTATGREQHIAYAGHDAVVGWSPGGSLVFTSDRGGSTGLWQLPFADGRPGAARPISAEVGSFVSHGVSASGAIYFCRCEPQGGSDVKIAEFDFATGRFLSAPLDAVQEYVGTNSQPFWSNNGKLFVYRSLRRNQDPLLIIRSVETGETREIRPKLREIWDPRWSPDDRSIMLLAGAFSGQWGLYRVDVGSGTVSLVMAIPTGMTTGFLGPENSWAPDGKTYFFRQSRRGVEIKFVEVDVTTGELRTHLHLTGVDTLPNAFDAARRVLYYRSPIEGTDDLSLRARVLDTGAERDLLRGGAIGGMNLSPNGRFLAVARSAQGDVPAAVLLVPVDGQPPVEIVRAEPGEGVGAAASLPRGPGTWALDSKSLLIRRGRDETRPEFWWVPIDGRPSQRVPEFDGLNPQGLRVHPDGKRLLFGGTVAGKPESNPTELWVWEGLLAPGRR